MSLQRRKTLACSGMTGLLFLAMGSAASEQGVAPSGPRELAPGFVEEVLVTAQKREQRGIDVPVAITALSGERLELLGVDNLQELSEFVPGVRVQEQSVIHTGIAIRGVTSDTGSASQSPRVSVYQNGVDISRSRGANVALYDLNRVEAVKGPQGTLFGRGAEVGALSIVQNSADLSGRDGRIELSAGNYAERRVQGFINTPIVDDEVALRLAFYHNQHTGYVDNLAGGELSDADTTAARLSFSWQPSDAVHWQSWINYQDDNSGGTPFLSFYFPEGDEFSEANLDAADLKVERYLWDATVQGDIELGDGYSLTSITAWREYEAEEIYDADGFSLPVLAFDNRGEHRQFSQELRLNFDTGGRLAGFIGGYYQRERGLFDLTQTFHEGYLALLPKVQALLAAPDQPFDEELLREPPPLYAPWAPLTALPTAVGMVPLNPKIIERQIEKTDNQSVDLFADATYSLSERWQLTAGVRASYEDLQTSLYTPAPASAAGLAVLPTTCADGFLFQPRCDVNGSVMRELEQADSEWGFSGRLLTRYEFADNWSGYASYARGRRPQVLYFNTVSEQNNQRSEEVDSIELGSKWLSDNGDYRFDLAAFYFNYDNFITAANASTPVPRMDDNGEAVSKGVEIETAAKLVEQLTAFANLTYNDARITHADDPSYIGYRFRLAPKWSGALGVNQRHRLGNLGEGSLTLSYSFQSEVFFEDNNRSNFGRNKQSAYGLWNLRYGFDSAAGRWGAQLWVDNLLDEKYILDAGNTGGLFGLPTYVPGMPRTFGASVSLYL